MTASEIVRGRSVGERLPPELPRVREPLSAMVIRSGGSPQECARVAERDAGRCQRRRGSQARVVEACKRVI